MTTSLSLSKELWEAGLNIKTEKCWSRQSKQDNWGLLVHKIRGIYHIDYILPAFSTDELLAVMPDCIKNDYDLTIKKLEDEFFITYERDGYAVREGYEFKDESLPEALGKMCLWLLNNGYHYNPQTKMIER